MDGCSRRDTNHTTAKRDSQPKSILKATNISAASEILLGWRVVREKNTYILCCVGDSFHTCFWQIPMGVESLFPPPICRESQLPSGRCIPTVFNQCAGHVAQRLHSAICQGKRKSKHYETIRGLI